MMNNANIPIDSTEFANRFIRELQESKSGADGKIPIRECVENVFKAVDGWWFTYPSGVWYRT